MAPNQACQENDTAWQFTKTLTNIPFEYSGAEKQTAEKSDFVVVIFLIKTLD